MNGKLLIAGAGGIVGRATLAQYAAMPGWEIIGLARRPPDTEAPARFIQVDLADAADCRDKLADLRGVTHIVYAALFEKPNLGQGWLEADQIAVNRAMLTNLFDAIEAAIPACAMSRCCRGRRRMACISARFRCRRRNARRATSIRTSIGRRRIFCARGSAARPGPSQSCGRRW